MIALLTFVIVRFFMVSWAVGLGISLFPRLMYHVNNRTESRIYQKIKALKDKNATERQLSRYVQSTNPHSMNASLIDE